MKRPAAALCDSSAEDAGQTKPCEVHDAGPPTPEDPVDLPPTFARRAMPTSIKGNALEKYTRIVHAYNYYIAPTVVEGGKTAAEDI